MSTTSQVKSERQGKNSSGWDQAIADARKKIEKLEFSIRVFKQRKEAGEQWPGSVPVSAGPARGITHRSQPSVSEG
jgi:hypothetical protein